MIRVGDRVSVSGKGEGTVVKVEVKKEVQGSSMFERDVYLVEVATGEKIKCKSQERRYKGEVKK